MASPTHPKHNSLPYRGAYHQRASCPPVSPTMSRSNSDINEGTLVQPSFHAHRSTNPPEMHNLPLLIKLSEEETPTTNTESQDQVSNKKQNQKQKHHKRQITAPPRKPLPNRPLPTKPLPSAPNNNRLRSKSDQKTAAEKDVKHVLGTIQIHHDMPMTAKPITFNYNYSPTRNKSHTVTVHHRRDNNRRNVLHIKKQLPPHKIRSRTPEPRKSNKVITPTTASKSGSEKELIHRLNRQNSDNSSESESLSSNKIPSIKDTEDKPPPAVFRKKPESPQYRNEHLKRTKKKKRHKPIKPTKANTPLSINGIMPAASRLRIKSTPNIGKRNKNTFHNNYNNNYIRNGHTSQSTTPTPLLSMSYTSQTGLEDRDKANHHKHHHKKNQIPASDTLFHIKRREQMMNNQQNIANVEQLFAQQSANVDEAPQYNDPQQAFLDLKQRKGGGSSINLSKRILEHEKSKDSKEIALPASFAKYKDIKKTSSIPSEKDNNEPFIPPPPGETPSDTQMKYIDSDTEDDDNDDMEYLDYLNGPSHVVLKSMDSAEIKVKGILHKRGRSNSVPNIGTMYTITADNVDKDSDSDHYSFSDSAKQGMNKDLIANLKITTSKHGDDDTPSQSEPFEIVIDDEEHEDSNDNADDTDVVVLQKERKNTRSRSKHRTDRGQTELMRSQSNRAPRTKKKTKSSHIIEKSMEFEDVASMVSAPAMSLKRKKKWYHGIFGKAQKVDGMVMMDSYVDDNDTQSVLTDIPSTSTALSSTFSLNTVTTDDDFKRTPIFNDFHREIALTNREVASSILLFASSDWNYDSDSVHVYRAQCATLQYEEFIPCLAQIIYPTITSSLSLPINAQSQSISYSVYCKYNVSQLKYSAKLKQEEEVEEKAWFIGQSVSTFDLRQMNNKTSILFHHEKRSGKLKEEEIEMVSFSFSHQTTTQSAIKEIWHKICNNAASYELKIQLQFLDLENFVLKTCGREEYLRFKDDTLIVSSNYIRNCLRHNEYRELEFVLFYVSDLNTYNDVKYRESLKEWYRDNTYDEDIFEYYAIKPLVSDIVKNNVDDKSLRIIDEHKENQESHILAKKKLKIKEKQLKYEDLGYNCIVDTLIGSKEKNKLSQLNLSVENEVEWLRSTIGSVLLREDKDNIRGEHRKNVSSRVSVSEQIEIDWENLKQSAVLLDEFEHPIEIKIKSLKNICSTPRYCKNWDLILIRIELMFGSNTFEECSWDIRIPSRTISNNIKIPAQISTFSSECHQLFYSNIPREATWCFTVYGVTENELESDDKRVKQKRVKLKHINNLNISNNSAYADLNYCVNSEFKLFNKSKKKKNSYSTYIGASSPYTPRGAQLKTKSKYTATSDTASTISSISNSTTYNGISVSLSSSNADIISIYDNTADDEEEDNIIIDELDDNNVLIERYHCQPLAWCRLPVINSRHCISRGSFELHLWSVPKFKYSKGGPKFDPYRTGFWKKFGTTTDRKYVSTNPVLLNIEFPHFVFDIVAALVNPRRPEYVLRSIKPYKRREFPGKQVLLQIIEQDGITPLDDKDKMLVYSNKEKLMRYPEAIATFLRSVDWLDVELRMEAYDYLFRWKKALNPEDMIELLRYEFCDSRIRLYSINCLNQLDDYTLNRYLLQLVQALKNELHHNSFLSRFLIFRALRNPLQIGHYLFWHFLSEYISSYGWKERFGLLIEEYLLHLPNNLENIGVHYSKELLYQNNLMNRLREISTKIQYYKKKSRHKLSKMYLEKELNILNHELGENEKSIGLPLDPSLRCLKLQIDRCTFMSSAKAPLWLVFSNADPYTLISIPKRKIMKKKKKKKKKNKYDKYKYFKDSEKYSNYHDIQVMYKCGDDLRQDILTLQLISVMDAFWLKKNCDLRMKPYQVIQTGHQCGMVELILYSKTTNDIHSKHGTLRGAFNHKAHLIYLKCAANHYKDLFGTKYAEDIAFKTAQENYARSCAGYSVATWVLGIGDRHPSNIMIHKNGNLFHIDFGHFLGNFKEKQIGGGLIKFNRERSPFVFTSLMKYAIDEGIDDAQLYREFVQWIFKAYSEVRCRYKFFLNLFLLMIPSHMPELMREKDVKYLRNALRHDLTNFQDIAVHVEKTLKQCLNDKYRLVDNGIHARKHAN